MMMINIFKRPREVRLEENVDGACLIPFNCFNELKDAKKHDSHDELIAKSKKYREDELNAKQILKMMNETDE